jgi:dTDP-4-dehydrorhamnose 3,5-epimerase
MPFTFTSLELPGVVLISPQTFNDPRGLFLELYKHSEFAAAGIADVFVQDNQSRSSRGTLRGLHFQRPPAQQAKLIRVVDGEIFDVAVDMRADSPTYLRWVGVTLSSETGQWLYVPPWCAHGFCVLSESADVFYKTSAEYAPRLEAGLAWNDPAIGIAWPVADPVLSERDSRWPLLNRSARARRE